MPVNCTYVNAAAKAHGRSAAHFLMESRDGMQMSASEPPLDDDNAWPRRHAFTIPLNIRNEWSFKPPPPWGGFHFNMTYINSGPVKDTFLYLQHIYKTEGFIFVLVLLRQHHNQRWQKKEDAIIEPVTNVYCCTFEFYCRFIRFLMFQSSFWGKVFISSPPTQTSCNSASSGQMEKVPFHLLDLVFMKP